MEQVRPSLRQVIENVSEVHHSGEVEKIARAVEEAGFKFPDGVPDTVAQEAETLIRGQRQKDYGHPSINFKRIADSWSAFLGIEVTPVMVSVMMILLKAQRVAEGYHHDTIVDIIGYASLAAILEGDNEL